VKISEEQFARIMPFLPVQRGNVVVDNLVFLNALLYVVENGCKWRALPSEYGKWYTVYQRAYRWAQSGALEKVFLALQRERILEVEVTLLAVDSTSVKIHPDGHGSRKEKGGSPSGRAVGGGPRSFMWLPRMTRLS
jgi:transposase